jgi:hypothetical protein
MSYGRARGLPRTKFSPSAPFHLLDLRSVITVRHRVTRPAARRLILRQSRRREWEAPGGSHAGERCRHCHPPGMP